MHTHKRILTHVLIAIAVLATTVLLPASTAEAVTYPKPPWWTGANGANCDDTNYYSITGVHSTTLATWNGVKACGPLPGPDGDAEVTFTYHDGPPELEWQCAELVKRYLQMAYSKPSQQANGDEVVDVYADTYPDTFVAIPNDGSAQAFPKAGDILSYSNVHTALITDVTVTDAVNGDATLSLLEQNASANGTTTQLMDNWIIQGGIDDPNGTGTDTVTAWLTPVWSFSSISNPGTYNNLTSLAFISSTDIWAVGHSTGLVYGLNHTYPTAYHWNGTSWTGNTNGTSNYDNLLYGVSAVSSSNVVAVGGSIYNVGFAMKYNGTSWSSLTVDRPGSLSPLMAVSTDANGNTWAVGYTLSSGSYRPLFEQYNGSTAFTKVGDPFGTYNGSTDTRLFGVDVNASNDAWAVGYYVDVSSHRQPITMHYDGNNWQYVTTPVPQNAVNVELKAVTIISSSDVWAVGYASYSGSYDQPVAMHWDGSSWTIDTNALPLVNGGGFYAVHAASSGTVYAVGITSTIGTTYPRPLVMRYNGTNWIEISVPTNMSERFNGIFVTGSSVDDAIWAVGGKSSSSTSNLIELGSVK